jgi:hypothetical protein
VLTMSNTLTFSPKLRTISPFSTAGLIPIF